MEKENKCPVAEQLPEEEIEPTEYSIDPDGSIVETPSAN